MRWPERGRVIGGVAVGTHQRPLRCTAGGIGGQQWSVPAGEIPFIQLMV